MTEQIRRIRFEELPAPLRERLAARVQRLGYFGEFFQCAAHQPAALAAFIDFTEAAKGALPQRLVEVAALTCANWSGNAYERNQHERLCVRLGFGRDWVENVNCMSPAQAPLLCALERQVQTFVIAALETQGRGAHKLLPELVGALGVEQVIAVLMVTGRYIVHGIVVNALALDPPVPSIFEDGFDA